MKRGDEDGESVQSVENAFVLLRELANGNSDRSAANLASATGLSKPAIYRLLRALQRSNVVARDAERGRFSIAIGLRELAANDRWQAQLRRIAVPEMYGLRTVTGESIVLYGLIGPFEAVCIETIVSPQSIRHEERVGERFLLARGATSMVLLADRVERAGAAIVEEWLGSCRPADTPAERTAAMRAIALARDGATTTSQRIHGCCAIAAPIRYGDAPVNGVLAISGPQDRFSAANVARWTPLVREVATRIGRKIA